jgi:glycosyltransferase involved in cell wall biosynthesis
MKICCLEPILAPYTIPRFRALQSMRQDYAVQVMALGATQRIREWQLQKSGLGFEYVEAFSGETVENVAPRALTARVTLWLEESDPHVVLIAGYYYAAMRAAARWAARNDRVSILFSDTQLTDKRRSMIKETMKGWWVRRYYDSAFVPGERATAYLTRLGFSRERIWTGYYVVDNQTFAAGAAAARSESDSLRTRLGLPDRYFLFVGRFAPEKNLPRLLEAYGRYRASAGREAWGLVLVGSGPLVSALGAQAVPLQDVVFAGFHQIDTLSAYYGLASAFVLPSLSEPWGLVVNEAMAAGLPVLVSHHCGCVPELVRPGLNGYVCDPYDIDGLARLMGVMSSETAMANKMGEASRRIVGSYTPEIWAETLVDCIERTMALKQMNAEKRRVSWWRRSLMVEKPS